VIRHEMQELTVLSVFCVMAIFYAAFRSLTLLLLVMLPLGFGVCAGVAVVQNVYGYVHGVTLAFGSILIGIAIDYPIHLISHTVEMGSTRAALAKIWPTLRLGMLTTVAAFLPISFSSFPGLSQLGMFTIVGLLVAAIATRWLLPRISPDGSIALPSSIWDRIMSINRGDRWPRLALGVLSFVAVVYITNQNRTIWETDLRNISPTPVSLRALDRRLRAEMGVADVRHLLVLRQPSMEDVLRGTEALASDLQALVDAKLIAGFDMAARYLPSIHSQDQRRRDLPDRSVLQANLDLASYGLPFKPGLFEPFLHAVEQSKLGP
jgi:predicted exporter